MAGILGKLFGSKKTTDTLVNAAIGGVDSLFTTKEEKIGAINAHLKTLEPFKILQRLLVLSITFVFLMLLLVASAFIIASGFGFEKGQEIVNNLTNIVVDWNLGFAFTAIVTVYISGGVLKKK